MLRSRYNSTVHAIVAAAFAAGAITTVAIVATQDWEAPGRLVLAAVALLFGAVSFRLSRLRVVLHADHVELVNPLRTHRIPWREIDAVEAFVFAGWRVRVWSGGRARVAFGLSQYSKYTPARPGDDVDEHAPKWLSQGYHELRDTWQERRRVSG
ncbi:hypothetical protein GCM10010112_67000 [Actinoplanes lobatus]|uniref:Low molecular weight protein antigen 6 PH domain-containing protein n=1 Tax=Actinoplanes lobatus TaxID=113568 RepID=A0ABQ4ARR0_9ACTN|nr:hypothetical protein GCM10010112_67000 [Actinoplanes lobatus]GIE43545.1 hypothetical protein Alo02nite_64430 [Actinoplanes lobatus]